MAFTRAQHIGETADTIFFQAAVGAGILSCITVVVALFLAVKAVLDLVPRT